MKRSLKLQVRTTSKSKQPFWTCVLAVLSSGQRVSCQHCLPTPAACSRAPRKRSHRGQKRVNQSFKFSIFLENKGVCGCLWGKLWELFQRQKRSGTALLWSVSLLKALFLWGRENTHTCRPAWRSCTWLQAPMWSRLFFIFTLYEANGICSWLTSNLEKWSSLGLQLAGLRLLVVLKWVRQQQVFSHKSREMGMTGRVLWIQGQPAGRGRLHLARELQKQCAGV